MSAKKIVIFRGRGAPATVEFPEGEKAPKRSCFGALRLFPGIPRAVTAEELAFIEKKHPAVYAELEVRPYVESRRVDRRGATEAEVERLAAEAGISHLPNARVLEILRERGKLKDPPRTRPAAKPAARKPEKSKPSER